MKVQKLKLKSFCDKLTFSWWKLLQKYDNKFCFHGQTSKEKSDVNSSRSLLHSFSHISNVPTASALLFKTPVNLLFYHVQKQFKKDFSEWKIKLRSKTTTRDNLFFFYLENFSPLNFELANRRVRRRHTNDRPISNYILFMNETISCDFAKIKINSRRGKRESGRKATLYINNILIKIIHLL